MKLEGNTWSVMAANQEKYGVSVFKQVLHGLNALWIFPIAVVLITLGKMMGLEHATIYQPDKVLPICVWIAALVFSLKQLADHGQKTDPVRIARLKIKEKNKLPEPGVKYHVEQRDDKWVVCDDRGTILS